MADYTLEGPKWGNPVLGSPGGVITWAFDASVPSYFAPDFSNAFSQWSAFGNIQFQQLPTGSAANIVVNYGQIDGSGNIAGITNYSYSNGTLNHASITIDAAESWHLVNGRVVSGSNNPLELVAAHEEGHAIGLGHFNASPAVMNATIPFGISGLQQPDIDGIRAIYGEPAASQYPNSFLEDFGLIQGWGSPNNPRILADVDHNGSDDYVAFGNNYTFVASGGTFSDGQEHNVPGFAPAVAAIHDFGVNEGYTAAMQRGVADIGTGNATAVYGQGNAGIWYYDSQGQNAQVDAAGHSYAVPTFASQPHLLADFGANQGWTEHNGFEILKTSQSDAYTSVLGFGNNGIVVGEHAFQTGAPTSSYVIHLLTGNSSGWDQLTDVRTFQDQDGGTIDLNKDGIADFLGMGPQGSVFAFGQKDSAGHYGLGQLQTATFGGSGSDLGRAQGWTDQNTTRVVVHDDITGYDDVFAFGGAGVYVAQGQDPNTHDGQPFGALHLGIADFGTQQGWLNALTPRLVGDVNGDGTPDIVGFGANSTFVALGSRNSAGQIHFAVDQTKTINDFGYNEGWDSHTLRSLADVHGTGHDSLVLSGASGTQVWDFF